MSRIIQAWKDYWFAPDSPINLGVSRFVFYWLVFIIYAQKDFAPWGDVPREFWQPHWLFELLHLGVLPGPWLAGLHAAWKVTLLAAAVGILTRFSTVLALLLGLYLLGLRHCFGKVSHEDAVLIWIFAILAMSRCADSVSLDRLIFQKKPASNYSGEYRWPIRAVWLVLALIFFNSALSKLRHSGFEWVLSENLSVLLVRHYYYNNPPFGIGLTLAQHPWLCRVLAGMALASELLFPLVLFHRVARWILVPVALAMHIGNKILLGVDFTPFMVAYAFFVNWRAFGARLKAAWMSVRNRARPAAISTEPGVLVEPMDFAAENSAGQR